MDQILSHNSEQIQTKPNSEPIGHLFGLFGLTNDEKQEVNEEKAIDNELNEDLMTSCQQMNANECIVCKNTETKYRCPKCQLKTCSLICCKRHKIQFDCNGVTDKTSFVKISDFSEQEFLSDYFFLEDIDQTIDNVCRQRRAIINSKPILPKWIQRMIREARLRGITLKIMPAGFQRRKQNTTCFMYSEKTINWDIELKFIHALDQKDVKNLGEELTDDLVVSHSEFTLIKRRVCENTKLSELITPLIGCNDFITNYEQNKKLILYRNSGIKDITVLFKCENQSSKNLKYFELDFDKSISQNLKHKTVIEFPTFVIVLNKFKHLFDIKCD